MDLPHDARRDLHAERVATSRRACHRVDDACGLHLELDGAVQVEVPVGAVLVVANRGDGGDHQLARTAYLRVVSAVVPVLPQHARILLMDADDVLAQRHLSVNVRQVCIQVPYLSDAVASQLQRVGELAEAVLSDVEDILAGVGRVIAATIGRKAEVQPHQGTTAGGSRRAMWKGFHELA
eukprot:scaffold1405_cov305-Prasinococcus_capsulatus_cf.AAC.7